MKRSNFNPYREDDSYNFSNYGSYPLDNEMYSDEYEGFQNINAIDLEQFYSMSNISDTQNPLTNSMMDSDFIPFNSAFASSPIIPFGNSSMDDNKTLPTIQTIPQDSTLLNDIENNNIILEPFDGGNQKEPSNISGDTSDQTSLNDEMNNVTEIIDIYEVERILNNIEENDPLVVQALLGSDKSYPNMRILLRRIIKLTLRYHYEK